MLAIRTLPRADVEVAISSSKLSPLVPGANTEIGFVPRTFCNIYTTLIFATKHVGKFECNMFNVWFNFKKRTHVTTQTYIS